MTSFVNADLVKTALSWRYATKQFDPLRKISGSDWNCLEESLRLSPSSFGVQPWKFAIVTASSIREELVAHSWKQRQVADASHLVVFAIKKHFGEGDLEAFLASMEKVRNTPRESFKPYSDLMRYELLQGPRSLIINEWATRQVYIALGTFMTSAALLGIDTCPLEGIDPAQYDRILGLSEKGLATVVACVAGYRAASDRYAQAPKVRFTRDEVFLRYE